MASMCRRTQRKRLYISSLLNWLARTERLTSQLYKIFYPSCRHDSMAFPCPEQLIVVFTTEYEYSSLSLPHHWLVPLQFCNFTVTVDFTHCWLPRAESKHSIFTIDSYPACIELLVFVLLALIYIYHLLLKIALLTFLILRPCTPPPLHFRNHVSVHRV